MNILLLGATGFIGRHTATLLQQQGHRLTLPTRRDINFLQPDTTACTRLFEGHDTIINMVGIMSRHDHIMETVHHHTPKQLMQCAREAGVSRWVQLSAHGADPTEAITFIGSKGRGDAALADSGLSHAIVRPSLVFGRGGNSTEAFIQLARLPLITLPDGGRQIIQPVAVGEVAQALAILAQNHSSHPDAIPLAGGSTHTLADYIQLLRQHIHQRSRAPILPIPLALMRPFLPLTKQLSNGLVSLDNLTLLNRGACADTTAFTQLLGHAPTPATEFIPATGKRPTTA